MAELTVCAAEGRHVGECLRLKIKMKKRAIALQTTECLRK